MIKEHVLLGINHQFLYSGAVSDPDIHTKTLDILAGESHFDALDFWISKENPNQRKELEIIQNCGKYLNYNIGDRYGQKVMIPASPDKEERNYAFEVMRGEIARALECGANKVIFGSGPDFPDDREEAKKRLAGFILETFRDVPQNIMITIEPTGRNMDKFFLLGPFDESKGILAIFTQAIVLSGIRPIPFAVTIMCRGNSGW